MQNILEKLIQMDIRATLSTLWKRFPLPVLLVFTVSLLWFYTVNIDDNQDWAYRTIITGIVVFFLATAVSLLHERVKMTRVVSIATWLAPLVFGICFYLAIWGIYDGDIEPITYTILSLTAFAASLFVAPFLPGLMKWKEENTTHFSNYFTQISWVVLMSLVVGGALMLLGSIAIGSVIALFDIDWSHTSDLYGNWAVIALSLTAPLYALTILPHARDYETKAYVQNKFFSFIIRYIATPFIFVYFLILYAYSAKVLMNFSDWPKGIVSWMVIGFSSFGYLVYILSRAYADESRMVAVFRRYFPHIVAPQILMLGYAIYLRINQYDLTMNRYFVVIFGIWLTLISLYYIISTKKSLSMIPASLVATILLISIGPWSVYSFPVARQEARLMYNLETAKILQEWKIVPLENKKDISRELSNDIYSGIEYICNFDNCQYIKDTFPEQYSALIEESKKEWEDNKITYKYDENQKYSEPNRWSIVSAITNAIKVERTYGYNEDAVPKYLQFNNYKDQYPLTVTGYDRVVSVYGSGNYVGDSANKATHEYITIDPDTSRFSYYRGSELLWQDELPTKEQLTTSLAGREVSREDLSFALTGENYDIRLELQNYALRNPEYTETVDGKKYEYFSISGIALIRDAK